MTTDDAQEVSLLLGCLLRSSSCIRRDPVGVGHARATSLEFTKASRCRRRPISDYRHDPCDEQRAVLATSLAGLIF